MIYFNLVTVTSTRSIQKRTEKSDKLENKMENDRIDSVMVGLY